MKETQKVSFWPKDVRCFVSAAKPSSEPKQWLEWYQSSSTHAMPSLKMHAWRDDAADTYSYAAVI